MQTMTSAYANKMLKSLSYRNMITQRLQLLSQLLMRRLQLSSMHLM